MIGKTKSVFSFMSRRDNSADLPSDGADQSLPEGELFTEPAAEETEEEITEGQLAVDVIELPDQILVRSTIAGVKPEDLDISVEGNQVTISGTRSAGESIESGDFLLQECYWGSFARSVEIPVEFDPEGVDAELKDGILTVILPKVPRLKPKKVMVRGR